MRLMKLRHFALFHFNDTDRHNFEKISDYAFCNYGDTDDTVINNNFMTAYINPDQIITVSAIFNRLVKFNSNDDKYSWVYAFYVEMFNGDVYWVRCTKYKHNQVNKFFEENIENDKSSKSRGI